MREWWIQLSAAMLSGMGACAANAPVSQPTTLPATRPVSTTMASTTQSASSQGSPLTEPHEPVAPPPPIAPRSQVVSIPTEITAAPSHAAATLPTPPVATTQPGPIDDHVAYGVGYSAGRRTHDRLGEDGRTADNLLVLKGFIDGLDDRDPAYPRQDVQAAFAEFQSYTQQRRAEKLYADNPAFRKRADDDQQKSRALLDQNAEMAGVDVRPDGVQIQILNVGNGRVVGIAHTLTLKNLRISLADGTLVKSTEANKEEKFESSDALPALTDTLRGVRVGTKCRIWLPPDKAYGLAGKPPMVGPNQAIEYELELINAE